MATGFKSAGNLHHDADHKDSSVDAGLDQLEAYANDPINRSTSASGSGASSGQSLSKGAQRFADNRRQNSLPQRQTTRRTPQPSEVPEPLTSGINYTKASTEGIDYTKRPKPEGIDYTKKPKPEGIDYTKKPAPEPINYNKTPKTPPVNLKKTPPPLDHENINPHKDINPEKAMGRFGKLGAAAKALATRNPKKLKGMGLIGLIICGLLMMFAPLLAEFKLGIFVENENKHGSRFLTHAFLARQRLIMKYWLKENMDPTFSNNHDSGISNYDRSMIRNLYGMLRGDTRIRRQLADAGYHIESRGDIDWPRGRIVSISYRGQTMNAGNFETQYRAFFEPQSTDEHGHHNRINNDLSQIVDNVFHGSNFQRRRIARRVQIMNGTRLHWLDRSTLPIKQFRNKIRNQVVVFILEHSGASRVAAAQLLAYIFGQKLDQVTVRLLASSGAEAALTATGALTTPVVTRATATGLTKVLGTLGFSSSNPIGWAIVLILADCTVSNFYRNGYDTFRRIAKNKARAEYGVQYVEMASAWSQLHDEDPKNDERSVGLIMEKLTDDANRDIARNNNYRRATGEQVPYYHTNDCESGLELCDDKRGQTMVDGTLVGSTLKRMKNDPVANSVFGRYIMFMGPTGAGTEAMCTALRAVGNFAADALIATAEVAFKLVATKGVEDSAKEMADKGGAWVMEKMFMPMIGWLLVPVVDASTRGPSLANAVSAGALGMSSQVMQGYCAPDDPDAKDCTLEGEELQKAEAAIRREDALYYQKMSLWDKVASINNPRSIMSRLIMSTPNNPQDLMARIANIPRLFFPPAMVHAVASANPSWFGNATALAAEDRGPEEKRYDPTGDDVIAWTEDCIKDTKLRDTSNPNCKGFDRFDDDAACTIIAGATEGQDVPPECNRDLDPVASGSSGATPDAGDAKALAAALLASKNINFDAPGAGWDVATGTFRPDLVRKDLEIIAAGGTIKNKDSCNNAVIIDPVLLNALYQASLKYKITIDGLVTTHGGACTPTLYHPQGKAVDIWYINDVRTKSSLSDPAQYNQEFSEYIAQYLPPNGEILQAVKCFPFDTGKPKKYPQMDVNGDTCDHIHISTGHR